MTSEMTYPIYCRTVGNRTTSAVVGYTPLQPKRIGLYDTDTPQVVARRAKLDFNTVADVGPNLANTTWIITLFDDPTTVVGQEGK